MSSWAARVARHAVHTRAAIQDEFELACLLDLIRDPSPRVVVELGTQMGGTFYALSQAAEPDALMISIDLDPLEGRGASIGELRSWCCPGQQISQIAADTHDGATLKAMTTHIDDWAQTHTLRNSVCPIDVLFIDADHHYAAVKQDHDWYSLFVRPGGWVVFHDIARTNEHQEGCDVNFYWRELIFHHSPGQVYHEFVSPGSVFGIGAYQK